MTVRKPFRTPAYLAAVALGVALVLFGTEACAKTSTFDQTPTVSAPATVSATEGAYCSFIATASDPDGEPIEGMSASPLPPGATFTTSESKSSGTLEWTPDYSQAGHYSIQITAVSACRAVAVSPVAYTVCMTGGASTVIEVAEGDEPPIVTAPSRVFGTEGSLLSFVVEAADPDGAELTSLTAAPLPAGATFTPNASNAEGTFEWTPAYGHAGEYSVTFTAVNALTGSASTPITIDTGPDRPPIVRSPSTVRGVEGTLVTFTTIAGDLDGQAIAAFTAAPLPAGATFTLNGSMSVGTFEWTPALTQAGTYVITLTAESACRPTGVSGQAVCASGSATTTLTIDRFNRAPTAVAGGPYGGIVDVAIEFDGSASSDPDGDQLTYGWEFGDGGSGTGSLASHSYPSSGVFDVTLTVSDGKLSDTAATTATVQGILPSLVFMPNSSRVLRLGSGKPTWCLQFEPVNGAYSNTDVVLESVTLLASFERIPVLAGGKANVGDDKNGNGVQELTACFSKDALRAALVPFIPKGHSVVTLSIEADLVTGGRLHTDFPVEVSSPGSALASTIAPNPLNPEATLTFVMPRSGWARVSLFDLQGRLMRRVLQEGTLSAGIHDVRVDGARGDGSRLPSGVYFYRVETSEGASVGRVVIAK